MAPLPPGENSWYASNRMLNGSQSRPGIFGEDKMCASVRNKAYSLISTATTLYKLPVMLMTAYNENQNCAV